MKRMQIILLLVSFSCKLLAQLSSTTGGVDTAWVRHYPANWTAKSAFASTMQRDRLGNIYITGYVNDDICTIKFSPNGDSLWTRWCAGTGNGIDRGIELAVDSNQCVYVTGSILNENLDYVTIKYNSDGSTIWARQYNGTGNANDAPTSIILDGNGKEYVVGVNNSTAGVCMQSQGVYSIIKYDTAGILEWKKESHGLLTGCDPSGHLFVAGSVHLNDTNYDDILIAKHNADGDTVWTRQFGGISFDEPYLLTVDQSGNAYVLGGVDKWFYVSAQGCISYYGGGFVTMKYDSSGDIKWIAPYGGDQPNAMKIDASGNVYVTGASEGDYVTVKYSSTGDTIWTRRYNTPGYGNTSATSLAIDGSGNVYVTGSSDSCIVTIKYTPVGDEEWIASYSDGEGTSSSPVGIRLDSGGNLYVAGTSSRSYDQSVYIVIKYAQAITSGGKDKPEIPETFGLEQNYPNPFNPTTEIRYHLPITIHHSLIVYDILGRKVATLVNEERSAGVYAAQWDASQVPSGVYFCRLEAGAFVETKKLLLLK